MSQKVNSFHMSMKILSRFHFIFMGYGYTANSYELGLNCITESSNGTKTEKSIEKILQEHATINGTDLELVSEHWPAG